MKNRSHRYDIRPRHGHKYTKYKMRLSIMKDVSIKQHLSNIWRSIHEKVKQHWGWVEKSVAYKKAFILPLRLFICLNMIFFFFLHNSIWEGYSI